MGNKYNIGMMLANMSLLKNYESIGCLIRPGDEMLRRRMVWMMMGVTKDDVAVSKFAGEAASE